VGGAGREGVYSKEDSKREDAQAPEHIKIAHDGKVGAAAILTISATHFHLGTAEEHTVFEAELVGILLGMQLINGFFVLSEMSD
jgi:hypothetical protein